MSVPSRHILQQGPVLGALSRSAYFALRQGLSGRSTGSRAVTPGPEIKRRVSPPPRALVDDYIQHVGGDPRAYRGELPPHLFPQWCMPAISRTFEGAPYPLLRIVNAGCRVEVRHAVPDREPLEVSARLEQVDDDGRRALLHGRVRTGTASVPDALVIDVYAIVPLRSAAAPIAAASTAATSAAGKERVRVPEDAREIMRSWVDKDAGLSFAKLTGDFNPIHWLSFSARASGFADVVLHGFSTLARAWEGLNKNVLGGDVHGLASIDAKLKRPLVLPRDIGLYLRGSEVFVGDAPGGPAYLSAAFSKRGG